MALPGGQTWWRHIQLLNKVPVAAGIMGSVAGAPAAFALLSHFTVMIKGQSQIFPSGPPVVRRAIGETFNKEELGGSAVHVHQSGQVDNEAESEEDAFNQIKQFLSYLPDTTGEVAPRVETGDDPHRRVEELLRIIPENRKRAYDPRKLVRLVFDNGEFFEMRRHWGGAIITGFARIGGYSVGVMASDPLVMVRRDERRCSGQVRAFRRSVRWLQSADGDFSGPCRALCSARGRNSRRRCAAARGR